LVIGHTAPYITFWSNPVPVTTDITALSTTAASNSPPDTEQRTTADDYIRQIHAFIASLYAGASNGQVVFPATQNASSDANTLDDYEEGTFTPTDGSGAGLTFTGAAGRYVKVGKVVNFTLAVTYPATASGSSAKFASLPFTAANANFPVAMTAAVSQAVSASVQAGTATVAIYTSAGGATTNANLSGTSVTLSGWYEATA
jgi:hypothetical protein